MILSGCPETVLGVEARLGTSLLAFLPHPYAFNCTAISVYGGYDAPITSIPPGHRASWV